MAERATINSLCLSIAQRLLQGAMNPSVVPSTRTLILYCTPADDDGLATLLPEGSELTIVIKHADPQGIELALEELAASGSMVRGDERPDKDKVGPSQVNLSGIHFNPGW